MKTNNKLSAFVAAALCLFMSSCIKMYEPQPEEEVEETIETPVIVITADLSGGYSAVLSCEVKEMGRTFLQGGFLLGLDPDLSDGQRLPASYSATGISGLAGMRVVASGLKRDTTYYYRAYITDRHSTEYSDIKSFRSASFTVEEADFYIPCEGGDFTVQVNTNEGFEAELGMYPWISVINDTKSVNSDYGISFHVEENPTFDFRFAKFIIHSPDNYFSREITLAQENRKLSVEDPVFQEYLEQNYDYDGNGYIEKEELAQIDTIILRSNKLTSLDGIQYMPNLRYLDFGGLKGGKSQLTQVDLSNNPKIDYLDLSRNNLDAIDLKNTLFLRECNLDENNLTDINLNYNLLLERLSVNKNILSTARNINSRGLKYLLMNDNNLQEIDFRRCSDLCYLSVGNNLIKSLILSNNKLLDSLICYNNKLEELYTSYNESLSYMNCSGNRITSLNLEKNEILETLDCSNNRLGLLDLHGNSKLCHLDCRGNDMDVLDLSYVAHINILFCNYNLSTLILPDYYEIEGVYPYKDDIHISYSTAIKRMNEIVEISDGNFKAYLCEHYDLDGDDEISVREAMNVTSISISTDKIGSLKGISSFINLKSLKCTGSVDVDGQSKGRITSLDLSANKLLERLYCYGNRINSLILTSNTKLQTLWCANNDLSSLDLSQNIELTDLNCENNYIFELNLFDNKKLSALDCSPMQVNSVNVLETVYLDDQSIPYINHGDYPRSITNIPSQTKLKMNEKLTVFTVKPNSTCDYTVALPIYDRPGSMNGYRNESLRCTISWGDGTEEEIVPGAKGNKGYVDHRYFDVKPGESFHVTVSGTVPIINASGIPSEMKKEITEIQQWGKLGTVCMSNGLWGFSSLTYLPEDSYGFFSTVETLHYAFGDCVSVKELPADLLANATRCKDISYAFSNMSSLESIPDGFLDKLRNVTTINCIFEYCTGLKSIPHKLFSNCTKITDISHAFFSCNSLLYIPEDILWNCTNISNAEGMFFYNSSVSVIPAQLFKDCTSLTKANECFESTGISDVPGDLFDNCPDLSDVSTMFYGCGRLTSISTDFLSKNNKVKNFYAMFCYASSIKGESPYSIINGKKVHFYERSLYNLNFSNPSSYNYCFRGTAFDDLPSMPDDWK